MIIEFPTGRAGRWKGGSPLSFTAVAWRKRACSVQRVHARVADRLVNHSHAGVVYTRTRAIRRC
jgi:hypothetical protein